MGLFEYLKSLELFADRPNLALICCHEKCKRAIPVATSHLVAWHTTAFQSAREELTKLLHTIDLQNPDKSPREDGSPSNPQLKLYNGYICRKYNTRTIDLQLIRKHNPLYGQGNCTARDLDPSLSDDHIEHVYLQTWAPINNRRYWIVEHNGTTIRPSGRQPAQDHLESVRKRQVERSRKRADSDTRMLCFAEPSPWLERTAWGSIVVLD